MLERPGYEVVDAPDGKVGWSVVSCQFFCVFLPRSDHFTTTKVSESEIRILAGNHSFVSKSS